MRLAAAQAKDVVDDTSLDRLAIRAAQTALGQAELNVERQQAGPLPADVKKAEAELAARQAELDKARFDLLDREAALAAKQAELDLKQQGPDELALIQARADIEAARIKVEQLRAGPLPADVRAAEVALDQERAKLDKVRDLPRVRTEEIANARADVQLAQAKLTKVLADIDAAQIKGEQARNNAVQAAQLELEKAQNTLTLRQSSTEAAPQEIRLQEQAVLLKEQELQKLRTPTGFDLEAAQVDLAAKQTRLEQLSAGPAEQEIAALSAQLQSIRYSIENARVGVTAAEATVGAARSRLDLVASGTSEFLVREARNQVSLARNNIETAQARLRVNQETIQQKRAVASFDLEQFRRAIDQAILDVQNFEAQTGDVKVVAPFAGRITRLAARPGDNVQAFFPILNLSSLEGLVVKADIAEADLPRLTPGMAVDLTMDAYPNQPLVGRIDALPEQSVGQVGQAPDRSTRVVVNWPGPGAEMGMLARVQVTLQIKPDVLMVPNGAVRTVGKRKFVEYLDGEIKRSRNVETGITTDAETEITSGVQEGMTILAGQS